MNLADHQPHPRIAALDLARGAAIMAMIVYHFGWNLSFLGLIEHDLRDRRAWLWFGHGIAAGFLVLVGIGLQLAHGDGLRVRPFLKRLGLVAGAAALVTLATFFVFPERYIFFGILHAIAVGSVLALPFLQWPVLWVALAAIIVFALPMLVQFEFFSSPWLIWLGLGMRVPATQDFVPVFPWFGCVLAGILLAKIVDFSHFAGPEPVLKPVRLLAWAGRNSLAIYLLHQPLLFGALSIVAAAMTSPQDMQARGFLSNCQSQCRVAGRDAQICATACQCAVEGLRAENLWSSVLADRLEPGQQTRFESVMRRCAEIP